MKLLLTCEHARSYIPNQYRKYFEPTNKIDIHRIFDPGALDLAERFADQLHAPLISGKLTRLIVDLNRTAKNPSCTSSFLSSLSLQQKKEIITTHHHPHWTQVFQFVRKHSASDTVLHLAVHSFTPIWKGRTRPTDIGLLYDPRRRSESNISKRWKKHLTQLNPPLTIHLNRPYRGWTDGITNSLRQSFGEKKYIGFELEVNQKFLIKKNVFDAKISELLISSLRNTLPNLT